jgi:hypothetical protein
MTPILTTSPMASHHQTRDPGLKLTLAMLVVLVSLSLVLALAAYIEARPNTPALSPGGEFDANRAFGDLKRLVSFGPRSPGSRALEQSRAFIAGELRAAGATVALDSFTASTPPRPNPNDQPRREDSGRPLCSRHRRGPLRHEADELSVRGCQ